MYVMYRSLLFWILPVVLVSTVAAEQYVRACYYTNWAQYRPGRGKFVPESYVPGSCTHIMYAFLWMNEDFTVKAYEPTDIQDWSGGPGYYERVNNLKKTDKNLKTLLSIGGWTFGTRLFKAMSQSAVSRTTFIQSVIAFIKRHGFNGLDIDWEYPNEDRNNFCLLLKEVRAAFVRDGGGLLLTIAVSAGDATIRQSYDIGQINEYVDFILLMSYDFHGAWEAGTGMNSPLFGRSGESAMFQKFNTNDSAQIWAQGGMPMNKIIIGIGAYGRGWTLANADFTAVGSPTTGPAQARQYTGEAGIAAYYELCSMLASGAKRYWQGEQLVPYLVQGNQWFGYDDVESVKTKMKWLKAKGYGGAFVWTLDLDDFGGMCGPKYPILMTIAEELTNGSFPGSVPTPATTIVQSTITQRTSLTISTATGATPRTPSSQTSTASTVAKSTTSTVAKSTTTSAAGAGFVCESDGFFRDAKNCATFYRCVSGRAFKFDCVAGTYFDVSLQACNHASAVKC